MEQEISGISKFPEKKDNLERWTEIFETIFRKFSVPFDFEPEFSEILVEWNAPENLQRKQNWNAKFRDLEENAGKIKSVFVIRAALWAEKLGRCLENCRSWKTILGKLVVAVNLEVIWFEVWMRGA